MLRLQQPAAVTGGRTMPWKQGVWQGFRKAVCAHMDAVLFETSMSVHCALTNS